MLFRYITNPIANPVDDDRPKPVADGYGVYAEGTHVEYSRSPEIDILMNFARNHIRSNEDAKNLILCMFRAIQNNHSNYDASDKLLGLYADLLPFVIQVLMKFNEDLPNGSIHSEIIQSEFRLNARIKRKCQALVEKFPEKTTPGSNIDQADRPEVWRSESQPSYIEPSESLMYTDYICLEDCMDMLSLMSLWIAEFYEPMFGFSVLISVLNIPQTQRQTYSKYWRSKYIFSGCLGRLITMKELVNSPQLVTTACGLLVKCPANFPGELSDENYTNFDSMVKVVWCFLKGLIGENVTFVLPASDVHSISSLCLYTMISRTLGSIATLDNPQRAWLNPKMEELTNWYTRIQPASSITHVGLGLNSVKPVQAAVSDLDLSPLQSAATLQALYIAWRSGWLPSEKSYFPLCVSPSIYFDFVTKVSWVLIVNGLAELTYENNPRYVEAGLRLNSFSVDYIDAVPTMRFASLNSFSVSSPKILGMVIAALALHRRGNCNSQDINTMKNISFVNLMIKAMPPFPRTRVLEETLGYIAAEVNDETIRSVSTSYLIQVFRRFSSDLTAECWKVVMCSLSKVADFINQQTIIVDYITIIHEMVLVAKLAPDSKAYRGVLCRQFSHRLDAEITVNKNTENQMVNILNYINKSLRDSSSSGNY